MFFSKDFFILFYMCGYLSACEPHECSAYRGQKMESGHLELELQVVIRYHVSAGN